MSMPGPEFANNRENALLTQRPIPPPCCPQQKGIDHSSGIVGLVLIRLFRMSFSSRDWLQLYDSTKRQVVNKRQSGQRMSDKEVIYDIRNISCSYVPR